MIKSEILNTGELIRHYTDDPKMALLQTDTGIVYGEAIDVNPTDHVYTEVPKPERRWGDDDEIS